MTQKELEALADLHDEVFYFYLHDRLSETLNNMIGCKDEALLRQLQGRAQMLADLIGEIEKADEKRAGRSEIPIPVDNRHRF